MGALATLRRTVRDAAFGVLPSRIIRRGPATRVALTFDDGPMAMTSKYLDVLEKEGVAATFFVMGDQSSLHPEMLREYVRRGHQIAGHGWNHQAFPSLSAAGLRDQLRRTDAVLGPQPIGRPWMRPPYGKLSPRVVAQMLGSGFTIALWSYESKDHEIEDADALVARVTSAPITAGEVLLFHEGYRHTLDALPRIIAHLRAQGLECVTMANLFAV